MGGVPVEQDLTEEQVLHFLNTRQHNITPDMFRPFFPIQESPSVSSAGRSGVSRRTVAQDMNLFFEYPDGTRVDLGGESEPYSGRWRSWWDEWYGGDAWGWSWNRDAWYSRDWNTSWRWDRAWEEAEHDAYANAASASTTGQTEDLPRRWSAVLRDGLTRDAFQGGYDQGKGKAPPMSRSKGEPSEGSGERGGEELRKGKGMAARSLAQFLQQHRSFVFEPRANLPENMRRHWNYLEEDDEKLYKHIRHHCTSVEAEEWLHGELLPEMAEKSLWRVDKHNVVEKDWRDKWRRKASRDSDSRLSLRTNVTRG